jgi:RNA polymerase sigma-70 factor (ECF subfamily)
LELFAMENDVRLRFYFMCNVSQRNTTISFEELQTHRRSLMRVALICLRDEPSAEDCVADAITQAYEQRQSFAGRSSVRTWLTAILKNRVTDVLRERRYRAFSNGENSRSGSAGGFGKGGSWIDRPTISRDPVESCQDEEFIRALVSCVNRLPHAARRLIVLRDVLGCGTKELCAMLGISESNCWVQLHRARLKLRTWLEKLGFGLTTTE